MNQLFYSYSSKLRSKEMYGLELKKLTLQMRILEWVQYL